MIKRMKQTGLKVGATLLAFIVGGLLTLTGKNLLYDNHSITLATRSLCEITAEPEKYDKQVVRIRAEYMREQASHYIYEENCQTLAVADFDRLYIENDK